MHCLINALFDEVDSNIPLRSDIGFVDQVIEMIIYAFEALVMAGNKIDSE